MPTTSRGRSSRKNKGNATKPHEDGMLDVLQDYDTGYPDIHSKRRFRGNGARPGNPFGREIPKPRESR